MSRFSTGRLSSSARAVSAVRAVVSRAAATGSFSAQARGGGGPSYLADAVGSSDSGSSRASRSAATHVAA